MEKIYIIEECVGMYSDSHSYPIKAYKDYEKAKAECDEFNKEMNTLQSKFDKLKDCDKIEIDINTVKEQIFKQQKPELYDTLYQLLHYDVDSSQITDEEYQIEDEYYILTDEAIKDVNSFIGKANDMKVFNSSELKDMSTYLTYLNNCYNGSIYDGLPSYYLSSNGVEFIE